MPAQVLAPRTPEEFNDAAARTAALLQRGGAAVIPTETVYGLAAIAFDPAAVARIYDIKGRPPSNPVIVHVCSLDMARQCASTWPVIANRLAAAFWPGPLTLVLERSTRIPDVVTGGGAAVAIRWPSHPFILEVIRRCGFPLAAPSANPSGRTSPTTARHALDMLGGRVPLIIDGGPSQVGIESTVVDLTRGTIRILRPGIIHRESLQAAVPSAKVECCGHVEDPDRPLSSPGRLPSHYAPKARLVLLEWADDESLASQVAATHCSPASVHILAHSRLPASGRWGRVSMIPHDAAVFARALYSELHQSDEAGAELIVVERPPEGPEWEGIADRLKRAATG